MSICLTSLPYLDRDSRTRGLPCHLHTPEGHITHATPLSSCLCSHHYPYTMFRSRPSYSPDDLEGTLPVLPLPQGSVLLPSSTLALQLRRPDSLSMLQALLDETSKKGGSSSNSAILAATPYRISESKELVVKGNKLQQGGASSSSDVSLKILTPANAATTTDGDGEKPSVNQLSECMWLSLSRL
jgi:hypothetical protein